MKTTIVDLLEEVDSFLGMNNIRNSDDLIKWVKKNRDKISDERLGLYKYVLCVIEEAQEDNWGLRVLTVIQFLWEVGLPSKELQKEIGRTIKNTMDFNCDKLIDKESNNEKDN